MSCKCNNFLHNVLTPPSSLMVPKSRLTKSWRPIPHVRFVCKHILYMIWNVTQYPESVYYILYTEQTIGPEGTPLYTLSWLAHLYILMMWACLTLHYMALHLSSFSWIVKVQYSVLYAIWLFLLIINLMSVGNQQTKQRVGRPMAIDSSHEEVDWCTP